MINGFAHVCLCAADLAVAERFYCVGLGLKKAFDFVKDGRVVGFYLKVARGGYIEIFRSDTIDAKANAPISHFCLEVDDLEPVRRQLTESGYKVTEKSLGPDHSWQMWTTDPNGVRIEFHQYTDHSCQLTLEDCVLK